MRITASARRRLTIATAAVALAFGAIALSRAHDARADHPSSSPSSELREGSRLVIATPELDGFVAFTQGAILADGVREIFAELRLEGRDVADATRRQPVSLAVVLDTSGSMYGEKIEQARQSVLSLAAQMHPEDRLAIITYDTTARVVQPLAPVGQVRDGLARRVADIHASGGTDIPAGLALGAAALSDAPPNTIHRLVLVSDGLDGSGRPLDAVGREIGLRANTGTTTSALGVGADYDERWLTRVADSGRGNYAFLARGGELAAFLSRELEQASTTVANLTTVGLELPEGWRVAEAYGGTFDGRAVPIGSLFEGERRRVTLRIEAAAGAPGAEHSLPVSLRYQSAVEGVDRNLDLGRLSVAVVGDEAQVVASMDVALHAEAVAQRVDHAQAQAIDAWRSGRIEDAERIARDNVRLLGEWRQNAPEAAATLDARITTIETDLDNFGTTSAATEEGRAYGLRANAARRSRMEAF
ncbi:MAG: VWA domain-containing protein [Myxococcales bacterium]|nr:VWA domain-containing protein [Myxococcales bacterium]